MKKLFLFFTVLAFVFDGYGQSVGLGTTTPSRAARLHVVGAATDTSIAALIDGSTLGTGLQVIRGGVGIGPFLPAARLLVATDTIGTGIDGFAAIVGFSRSDTAALYGGVYGTYDPSLFGVGMQGIGYNGFDYNSIWSGQIDVGVHGSADVGLSGIGNIIGIYAEAADLADAAPEEQYAVYASTSNGTAATKYAGYFDGDVSVTGTLSKGSGTFKIDHPIDPANKYLYHSFVESPEMMNIYNGNITTDANGMAEVKLPDYFNALNREFRYQLTTIGVFAQAIVKEEISDNHFIIQTDKPNVKVSWQVTGVRKDKYAEAHQVQPEVEKEPWNKGLFLHAREHGMDQTKSIAFRAALLTQAVNGTSLQSAPQPKLRKTAAASKTMPFIKTLE